MVLELEEGDSSKFTTAVLEVALADAGILAARAVTRGDTATVLFKRGYVLARFFPDRGYCACDIVFWSDLGGASDVERTLRTAFRGKEVSSYRIVTAGVQGVVPSTPTEANGATLEEEENMPIECKNEAAETTATQPVGREFANAALQVAASSFLRRRSSSEALILCGADSQPCGALDTVAGQTNSTRLSTFHACPESESIFNCESKFRSLVLLVVCIPRGWVHERAVVRFHGGHRRQGFFQKRAIGDHVDAIEGKCHPFAVGPCLCLR